MLIVGHLRVAEADTAAEAGDGLGTCAGPCNCGKLIDLFLRPTPEAGIGGSTTANAAELLGIGLTRATATGDGMATIATLAEAGDGLGAVAEAGYADAVASLSAGDDLSAVARANELLAIQALQLSHEVTRLAQVCATCAVFCKAQAEGARG